MPRTAVVLALLGLVGSMSTVAACDSCSKPEVAPAVRSEAGAEDSDVGEAETPEPFDGSPADLGRRFRDAAPKIEGGAGDAEAPIDPACSGASLTFATVLLDPRCAIGSSRAKLLRAEIEFDGGAAPLKQEAKLDPGPAAIPDGVRVALRLVNTGSSTLTLPLIHHSKLPAFTALAEDAHRAIFELDPPKLENVTDSTKPRFAVLALPAGGGVTVTVTVGTTIARRIAPACEAGTCAPPKLPKGKYTLYLGQLVTDVEAGAPARVEITVP